MRCLLSPLLSPLNQACAGIAGTFRLINHHSLLHHLLSKIPVLLVFAFTSARCRHILECVKDVPLLRHDCSRDQGQSLPIQDFPPAIVPEAKGHQDYHLFAVALMSLPLPFLWLDLLVLTLDRDPNSLQLDDWGTAWKEVVCVRLVNGSIGAIRSLSVRRPTFPSTVAFHCSCICRKLWYKPRRKRTS